MFRRQETAGMDRVSEQETSRVLRGLAGYTAALGTPESVRGALLILLAATSGYVDALSYLGFGHVFTSNMTGNTVLLGLALGQGRVLDASRSAVALAGFLAGVAVGALVVDRGERRAIWPSTVTAGFAVEALILVALAIGGAVAGAAPNDALLYALIALSAIAMGIQSVAVRALGVSGVTTTYITGTWTTLISSLTNWLRSARRLGSLVRPSSPPPASARLQAAVVVIYVLAAVAGAVAETRWLLGAAVLPAIALSIVLAVACFRFRQPEQDAER
jgi:uncharacterized membrane protein YoaK (UPF0700 family)